MRSVQPTNRLFDDQMFAEPSTCKKNLKITRLQQTVQLPRPNGLNRLDNKNLRTNVIDNFYNSL